MNFLLDENLNEDVAASLNTIGKRLPATFAHIVELGHAGMPDEEIPKLCADHGIAVLVTVNVKDFGARQVHFERLLARNVSVVVLRPGKVRFDLWLQAGLLSMHMKSIVRLIDEADGPVLIRVTQSGAGRRSLEELTQEEEGRSLP
ncbi:MAG: DUF5615 family PIN-like protein [Actinomycetota bacterium]